MYSKQPYNESPNFKPHFVLAYELGHTIMVGHGNGLDDNGDGAQAALPSPAPRIGLRVANRLI